MIPAAVSSLIYIKARSNMELFSPELMRLLKEWELRVLVVLSLILQVVLIFFGNRRKFISRARTRFLLWCAYLMADWVAAVALGVLLNKLGEVTRDMGALNGNTDLAAFWAPFLLLHLGGPDTITAYALEDNELWLRHFLGFAVQTGVATYIIFLGWRGSHLSILTLPMFLAGIIKYGERTWALRSASNERLRDSMLTPDAGPNYSKFMDEFTLRQYEGFHVTSNEMIIETRVQVDAPENGTSSSWDAVPIFDLAYNLYTTFKRIYLNLILSYQDRERIQSLLKMKPSWKDAFEVIEIELGFMFDMLYTKGAIFLSRLGCCLRFISLSSTFVVLVLFSFAHEKNHTKKTDLAITFLLLAVAIFLELYSILLLVSSDWTDLYLARHSNIPKAIYHFRLGKHPRWSNSLAQHSLLSFCLKSKPNVGIKIQKVFGIDKILEEHQLETIKEVSSELKESIFIHLKEKFEHMSSIAESIMYESELKALCTCRGDRALKNSRLFEDLAWSVEVEFDQSILIWHIATDLCYHSDADENQEGKDCKISKQLSHYMLYLLLMRPFMLPMGFGKIRYLDTCEELKSFLKERESISGNIHTSNARSRRSAIPAMNPFGKGKSKPDQTEASGVLPNSQVKSKPVETKACEMLLNVNTVVPPIKVKGDRSKSVLFDACRLASKLQNSSDKGVDWKLVSDVWIEILTYTASRCSAHDHARQLGQGGELLTHVWLLMAHFGLTEQFQISRGHARARLSVQ